MVNYDNDEFDDNVEITNDDTDTAAAEPELEDIEDAEENKLKSLRAKLQDAEEAKRQALEDLAVARADFLNAKRRIEDEKQRGIERQKVKDIEALLPLYDSFTMAMANTEAWEAVDATWRKGIEGIYQNLERILSGHGVESFDPTGEPFDPALHEAMGTTDSEEADDLVVETLQHGFRLNDTVIRHAKVILSA